MKLTIEQYEELQETCTGYCINCKDFTLDEIDLDAEEEYCPECNRLTLYGLDQALLKNYIKVIEDLEEDEDLEDSDEDESWDD